MRTLAVLADLRPALAAGLVVERGETLAFRHDLVRGALYDDLPISVRAELHRGAAASLPDAAGAAAHLEAARPPYDDANLKVMGRAAEEALKLDGGRAAALLAVLLEHIPSGDSRRVRLRARHAQALVVAGDLYAAHDVLRALHDDGFDTDLDVGLALLEPQGARDQPEPGLVIRLRGQAEQVTDDERRLDALGRIAFHAVRADTAGSRELLTELPQDAPKLPLDARVHLLLARAQQHWMDSDTVMAVEVAQHAYRLASDERASLVFGRVASEYQPPHADAIAAWATDLRDPRTIPFSKGLSALHLAVAALAAGDRAALDDADRPITRFQ